MREGTWRRRALIGSLLAAGAVALASCGDVAAKTTGQRKADARKMVESVLTRWDWKTWDQLLDENVVLKLDVAAVGSEEAVGGEMTIRGREEAKAALRKIYRDIKQNVSFWGEIAEEYEVALLGDLRVTEAAQQEGDSSGEIPFVAYLKFNEEGKVTEMTLATVDLRPLKAALEGMKAEPPEEGR